jgi:hypothetical protein
MAVALLAAAGCSSPDDADVMAARAISMSTPALSWEQLGVHPALRQRPCAVSTLVSEQGQVVGYCTGGRSCRTMDWRPVTDGCPMPPTLQQLAPSSRPQRLTTPAQTQTVHEVATVAAPN